MASSYSCEGLKVACAGPRPRSTGAETVLQPRAIIFSFGLAHASRPASQMSVFDQFLLQARLEAHHAAMDFSSPTGGRIISDPREAAAVSRAPSSRPLPLVRPQSGASISSLVATHTPGPELSAAWYRPQMGREQANLALFPHRQTSGLFLVRASSRSQQSFVLSFTTQVASNC